MTVGATAIVGAALRAAIVGATQCVAIAAALMLGLVTAPAHAIDPVGLEDPEQDARYRELLTEIRCLVCQNQTLADSNAPLAVDLREQVRIRIARGATDREIIDYLTARYGDFVLYRPPFKPVTAVLWLSPLLLLLVGALVAWRALRAAPGREPRIDDGDRERARALLDDEDAE